MLIAFIILIVAGSLSYLLHKRQQKRKRDAIEKRHQLVLFISQRSHEIKNAIVSFYPYGDSYSGYFTNHQLSVWKNKHLQLFDLLRGKSFESLTDQAKYISEINQFLNCYKNSATHRAEYNKEFIKKELAAYRTFFDDVEKRKLDLQQRLSIVTDEDNNIIIAGAGSGKTTTIVGKVKYVMDRYKVPGNQILLISFTKKSASALADRINIAGIEAATFHKFGKDVIADVEQKQPTLFDEKQFKQLITGFFEELLDNPTYLNKVTSYFTSFLKPEKSQDEFKNKGEYVQYLKDLNFSTYKIQEISYRGRITYKREVVKSIEECKIANFLLFNNIEYSYELPYEHETATQKYRQYKPDFTILTDNGKIYLEHFAINKQGKVPEFFADAANGQTIEQATQVYTDGIEWKRQLHHKYGTTLLETYSHEMFDDILFENLTQKLSEAQVKLRPKNAKEIWKVIADSASDEIDGFVTLFQTFITLMKSNNYSIQDVINKNKQVDIKFHRQRNSLFIQIIAPIFDKYQRYLSERKEIDFSDMINKATQYISDGSYKKNLSYIIIDEFQDISIGRYNLVKAIKDANPGCKLFCVGDDWQSIYRFSGSDIALFKEFEQYFGYSEKAKIETTYRFHDPLIKLSSHFILKNPNQTRKELRSIGGNKSSMYKIVYSVSDNQDDTYALQNIFDDLLISGKATGKEIFILGRYSFDMSRLKNEENIFRIDRANGPISYDRKTKAGDVRRLTAQFMTVHKSKGLEADIVIVMNCNSGKHGFPSGMSDDYVLNLLLSGADQFENGEERRLFYVAMTRAKEWVYFIADSASKSKFITELEGEVDDTQLKKCPRCTTADLVKRSGVKNGKAWAFYGCSNFIYGCDYQEWIR